MDLFLSYHKAGGCQLLHNMICQRSVPWRCHAYEEYLKGDLPTDGHLF